MALRAGKRDRRGGMDHEGTTSRSSQLSFAKLTSVLEPDGPMASTNPSAWRSIIDRNEQLIIFFQIDYLQASPNISKCVRIRRDRSDTNEDILIPVVFVRQKLQTSYAEDLLGRKNLMRYEDLTVLLDRLQNTDSGLLPSAADGYGSDGEEEYTEPSMPSSPFLSDLTITHLPSEHEEKEQGFEFDFTPQVWTDYAATEAPLENEEDADYAETGQDDSETSPEDDRDLEEKPAEQPRRLRGRKKAPKKTKNGITLENITGRKGKKKKKPDVQWTVPPPTKASTGSSKKISRTQEERLKHVVKEMKTPGTHKTELFPGSLRYLSTDRFTMFQSQMNSSPSGSAVELTMLFLGTHDIAIQIFTGEHFGLDSAFGSDFVEDIVGWINSNHPTVISDPDMAITASRLKRAFSRKMTYIRHGQPSWRESALSKNQGEELETDREGHPADSGSSGTTKKTDHRVSSSQVQILKQLIKEMRTPGIHKKELFLGSGRYLSIDRLKMLQTRVNKIPLSHAVNIALAFFGTRDTVLKVFGGEHFGLRAALGGDFVIDLAGYVNTHHPEITSGRQPTLSCEAINKGFSRRTSYFRKTTPTWKRPTPEKKSNSDVDVDLSEDE